MSTTVTVCSGQFLAIIAIVGPPTYPAPMQRMLLIELRLFLSKIKYLFH